MKRIKKGFTLLELLVVISIIGILVALGAVAFTTAQQKGRDAKRKGDLKATQNAFEQFYSEGSVYDVGCDVDLAIMPGGFPLDPKSGLAYDSSNCSDSTYCVCAALEGSGTGNASDLACAMSAGGDNFCVSNLQ